MGSVYPRWHLISTRNSRTLRRHSFSTFIIRLSQSLFSLLLHFQLQAFRPSETHTFSLHKLRTTKDRLFSSKILHKSNYRFGFPDLENVRKRKTPCFPFMSAKISAINSHIQRGFLQRNHSPLRLRDAASTFKLPTLQLFQSTPSDKPPGTIKEASNDFNGARTWSALSFAFFKCALSVPNCTQY